MNRLPLFASLCFALVLGACGGGGGAKDPAPTTPPTSANPAGPGQFLGATLLKTISPAEVSAALAKDGDAAFLATPRYAVQAWRITYLTVDEAGRQTVASGLVGVPQKAANAPSPVLSYQHATIKSQADAPSSLARLGDPPVVLASLGYIVEAADYVGFGVSAGTPHPYLVSAASASAVIDFLTASKYWRGTQHIADNKQLFLTGYSEGGYVTVAAQRALQAGTTPHRSELVRVVAGDGPYDVGATMDQLLEIMRTDYFPLGYVLNPGFLRYLGDEDRRHARDILLALLIGIDPSVVYSPTVVDNFLNDNRAAIDSLSSVYDWAPEVPLDLFHGRDDRTVPYVSATRTLQAMQARGAGNRVTLTDCVAQPAGHAQCVLPYWRFVLGKFAADAKDL
ncbi:alpha/beta hydrolase family protein [Caenimonas aquaedulcis]|uniref:Prolyl oligopeptidase family serine peptidase n=1 Tax=Caenimonas aquaedulcis TaxID=2793270 RepID=A0A931H8R8_9BURK|nr:prolyl oligopeptidase family serine peptidase [Caenimonas aquaedulcis]MBG9390628.1 prolyl oligopeptidase family serine peptidase [Caenimonas aquaedulcis]